MDIETLPILPSDYPLFDWSRFQSSYDALYEGGEVAAFKKEAWNAIVDSLDSLLDEVGIEWDDQYAGLFLTKVTAEYGAFFAEQFNSVVKNIENIFPSSWRWAFDESFRGYIGRKVFKGDLKYGDGADLLYPEYIKELVRRFNVSIEVLRGTQPMRYFVLQQYSYSNRFAPIIPQPSFPVIGSSLSFSDSVSNSDSMAAKSTSYKGILRSRYFLSARSSHSMVASHKKTSRSTSFPLAISVRLSFSHFFGISRSTTIPSIISVKLVISFAELLSKFFGVSKAVLHDLTDIILHARLFKNTVSIASAELDLKSDFMLLISYSFIYANWKLDDTANLANLFVELISKINGKIQDANEAVLSMIMASDIVSHIISDQTAGVFLDSHCFSDIDANVSIKKTESKYLSIVIESLDRSSATLESDMINAKGISTLVSFTNICSYIIVISVAIGVVQNICNAELNVSAVKNGFGAIVNELIIKVLPREQRVYNAFMQTVISSLNIANLKQQGFANVLLKMFEPFVGESSPKTQGFDDIRIQLGYAPILSASHEERSFDRVLIKLGYNPNSKIYPKIRGFNRTQMRLGYKSIDMVYPDLQIPQYFIFESISQIIGLTNEETQEVEAELMETSALAIGEISAETIEVPSQRGKILRIPSAYSATQNGNVLVVV